jgi:hypothetical protein
MDGRGVPMSTAATIFDQKPSARKYGMLAERIVRGAARLMRALVDELNRIPEYQDEAERRREELRRG